MCVRTRPKTIVGCPWSSGPQMTLHIHQHDSVSDILNGPRKIPYSKNMSKMTTNSTAAETNIRQEWGPNSNTLHTTTITYETFLHFSSRIYVYYSSSITMSICSLIQSAGIIRNDPGIISIYSERKRERERGKADMREISIAGCVHKDFCSVCRNR